MIYLWLTKIALLLIVGIAGYYFYKLVEVDNAYYEYKYNSRIDPLKNKKEDK